MKIVDRSIIFFIFTVVLLIAGCSDNGASQTAVEGDSGFREPASAGQDANDTNDTLAGNEIAGIGTVKPLDRSSIRKNSDRQLEYVGDQILVTFADGTSRQQAASIIASVGGHIVGELQGLDDYQVELDNFHTLDELYALADRLRQNTAVVAAGPNLVMSQQTRAFHPNDPWHGSFGDRFNCKDSSELECLYKVWWGKKPGGRNWGWEAVRAAEGWGRLAEYVKKGARLHPVKVGIIEPGGFANDYREELTFEGLGSVRAFVDHMDEQGLDPDRRCQPDTPQKPAPYCKVVDDEKDSVIPIKREAPDCDSGAHGMHVASIIGARHDNSKGVAGIAFDSSLYGFRYAQTYDIKVGILWLAKQGVRVVNMSFGVYWRDKEKDCKLNTDTTELEKFVSTEHATWSAFLEKLEHAGIHLLYVQAAGNENILSSYAGTLASLSDEERKRHDVLIVGALASSKGAVKANLSNYGGVDIFAPGENIYSIGSNKKVESDNGTSFAAPFVTGVAAELFAINPCLTATLVRSYLLQGAAEEKVAFKNQRYPVLDMDKAVELTIRKATTNPCRNPNLTAMQSAATDLFKRLVPITIKVKTIDQSSSSGGNEGVADAQVTLLRRQSSNSGTSDNPAQESIKVKTDAAGMVRTLVESGVYDVYAKSSICHALDGENEAVKRGVAISDTASGGTSVDIYLQCFKNIVSGHVKDSITGKEIMDAQVIFQYGDDGIQHAATDTEGAFAVGVMNSIDHAVLAVVADGYRYATIPFSSADFSRDGGHIVRDVYLRKADTRYIPVKGGWAIYHLGDDNYRDPVNSQFQKKTIGLRKTFGFVVDEKIVSASNSLAINLEAKGVQSYYGRSRVYINGKEIAYLPNSPSDGSYENVSIVVPLARVGLLYEKLNALTIESAQNNVNAYDHDDFEFTNLHLEIGKKNPIGYGEVAP